VVAHELLLLLEQTFVHLIDDVFVVVGVLACADRTY